MVAFTGWGTHRLQQWYDDIYIDNNIARVEVADHYDYAQITKKDIYPSTAWTTNQCQVTCKVHSFNSGDPAYLFVWNNNRLVNVRGYEVTIA